MTCLVTLFLTDTIKEGYSTESKLEITKQSDINDVSQLSKRERYE